MARPLPRTALLLLVASMTLAACNTTTRAPSSARVHAQIGYSPYWRYWGPPTPPIVIPPEPGIPPIPPEPALPIEPPDIMLPIEPGPDFGGGMGGFDAELF